ncbi:MAG: single-stranded DNA-binding protein [Bacteroidetes bacterium]|nr:MAG: single-stranded DNA-binding protein [Bacteroidota bacterium]PIE88200.1 MAG: single-stranded DNA-binding protein [Bacteroidota bacterium]
MAGVNKVILVGNLGVDPEVTTIESGIKKASFRIATTEAFKTRSGERAEHTEWHNITVWRGLADVAEKYLRKGSKIYLEGRIRTREYTDRDGNKRYFTDIQGDTFQMLDRLNNNDSDKGYPQSQPQSAPAKQPENPPVKEETPEDDLPF